MGHKQSGDPEPLLKVADLSAQLYAHTGVQCRERLVEEQNLGLDREGAGDGYTLLLAAGELMRITVGAWARPTSSSSSSARFSRVSLS